MVNYIKNLTLLQSNKKLPKAAIIINYTLHFQKRVKITQPFKFEIETDSKIQ